MVSEKGLEKHHGFAGKGGVIHFSSSQLGSLYLRDIREVNFFAAEKGLEKHRDLAGSGLFQFLTWKSTDMGNPKCNLCLGERNGKAYWPCGI